MPPVPKRSDQRRRNNKDSVAIEGAPAAEDVEVPPASEQWTAPVKMWYESLAKSGQAVFYEPSDWAQAWILAELLDTQMQAFKPNGMIISAWMHGAAELLTTEGARRRMRIELARAEKADPEQDAVVSNLNAFRDRFGT